MNVVTELLKISKKIRPKIIAIAEMPLENGNWMQIDGHTCYANTKADKYGCAIYIKNEYTNSFAVGKLDSNYVTLWSAGTEITFGYQRPHSKLFDPDDTWHKAGSDDLIIGDQNAKHSTWSEGQPKMAGNYLEEWMRARDLQVRNPRMGTHKQAVGATTIIDLVITDSNTRTMVRAFDVTSTNHRAISINTNIVWKPCQPRALRYDKANWNAITTGIMLLDEHNHDPKHV